MYYAVNRGPADASWKADIIFIISQLKELDFIEFK